MYVAVSGADYTVAVDLQELEVVAKMTVGAGPKRVDTAVLRWTVWRKRRPLRARSFFPLEQAVCARSWSVKPTTEVMTRMNPKMRGRGLGDGCRLLPACWRRPSYWSWPDHGRLGVG